MTFIRSILAFSITLLQMSKFPFVTNWQPRMMYSSLPTETVAITFIIAYTNGMDMKCEYHRFVIINLLSHRLKNYKTILVRVLNGNERNERMNCFEKAREF